MLRRMRALTGSVAALVLLLAGCCGYGSGSQNPGKAAGADGSTTAQNGTAGSPSAGGSAGAAGGNGQSFVFTLSASHPQDDLSSKVIKYWGDEVTQKTHGRIQFRYSWAGSLVSTSQSFDALNEGTVDITDVAASFTAGKVPAVSILQVPYAYPLMSSHVLEFYNQVNPIIDQIYQKYGQKVLFTVSGQLPVAVISRKQFYTTADAFKGTLIRTAGPWQAKTMEVWGAKPVVLDPGNLYTALQRGTVDSTLFDLELIRSYKIYEVAKDLTMLNSSINYDTLDMNLNQWRKLSPEDQQVMLDAGLDAQKYGRQLAQQELSSVLQDLQSHGVQVKTPDPAVINQLRTLVVQQVWPQVQKAEGPDGDKIMQVVQQFQPYIGESGS
ncbi:MAG: TRAP transporter substrate-binding protein [Alicyclobacillus sp.]|nr:TRAP transporter substrate-binding protein [Alicyclobacillus sp.]